MDIKLLALGDDALVKRVRYPAVHFHHDSLLHFGRNHLAHLFILVALLFFRHTLTFPLSRRLCSQLALPQDGENACAIFSHGAGLFQTLHLSHGHLQAQPEHLLFDVAQLRLEFRTIQVAQVLRSHCFPLVRYSTIMSRVTSLDLIGSLCAASRIAWAALSDPTPSISSKLFPGRIAATHG